MNKLKPVNGNELSYARIIGTGGIGSGLFFRLHGNQTLGRNESRLGKLVPCKDYCKQHIILHYISVLLGAEPGGKFNVFPIGRVGDDVQGGQLVCEMKKAGMVIDNVLTTCGASTLFSVCFQYPDSSGGNITTSESASSRVTTQDIDAFFETLEKDQKREIILAAPEVPIPARIRLLETGRDRGSLNVASVLSSEVNEFKSLGGYEKVDLLALNNDEARTVAGINDESADSKKIADACARILNNANPSMMIAITDGPHGSYCYSDGFMEHVPSLSAEVASTGGAGDAFISGIMTGLCCGLPFIKGKNDSFFSQTPLESAAELGTLIASLSVTSPDTINHDINAKSLYDYAMRKGVIFSPDFLTVFAKK